MPVWCSQTRSLSETGCLIGSAPGVNTIRMETIRRLSLCSMVNNHKATADAVHWPIRWRFENANQLMKIKAKVNKHRRTSSVANELTFVGPAQVTYRL